MAFSNKIAVVTGGSSGIGLATCEILFSQGAKVYNLDIQETSNQFSRFIHCDVSEFAQVDSAINQIHSSENRIDVLFANAGVHKFANIEQTSVEDLTAVMSINCFGVYYTLKAILPIMKKQQGGNILLMGSDQALIGKGCSSVYGMSKGAIAQLTKSTAIDYAEYNICINCICPGTCDTPLVTKAIKELQRQTDMDTDSILDLLSEAQPIQRMAKPEEIARTACFLLSSENSYMTGALIPVDGGYTCQ